MSLHRSLHVADSVLQVVTGQDPLAAAIMDRRTPMTDEFVDQVVALSAFDWAERNPRPAFDGAGNFQGTDLDLATALCVLAARGAVIQIPKYKTRRAGVIRSDERKIGSNSFGPITGLISNQEVFSFSVRIHDKTYVRDVGDSEEIGAHRNYMLYDVDGTWHEGWERINFKPNAAENRFLSDKKLWSGNSVVFRHFVHPNRWVSFWGAPYLLLKMLVARIDDEARFCRQEVKRLAEEGLKLPEKPYVPQEQRGFADSVQVWTLEAEMDVPFLGSHKDYKLPRRDTLARAEAAKKRANHLSRTLKPRAQFPIRADELAYFKRLAPDPKLPPIAEVMQAPWAQGVFVEERYRLPGKKIEWFRLALSRTTALRYRLHQKSTRVIRTPEEVAAA